MALPAEAPRPETLTATARSDCVCRPIKLRLHKNVPPAGDLDLVVGGTSGKLTYIENIGTSAAPVFVARTGSANPFDGISSAETPALGDLDSDGTLRPRPSIE